MSTTESTYARVDEAAMVQALGRAAELLDLQAHDTTRRDEPPSAGYAFRYDPATALELEAISRPHTNREEGR
jgi:hypothetical protein